MPFAPSSPFAPANTLQSKIIARASTLKLVDKSDATQPLSADDPNAIPNGSHWADETEEGTILVIGQPSHQTCAAVGGIMASRMSYRGVRGCVVGGRVRDLAELKKSGLPVSNFHTSSALASFTTPSKRLRMHYLRVLKFHHSFTSKRINITSLSMEVISLMHVTNRSGRLADRLLDLVQSHKSMLVISLSASKKCLSRLAT